MTHISTVLYPNDDDATFDMDYYIQKHMPLCQRLWGEHGLQKWQVLTFATALEGKPQHSVQAILTWSSSNDVEKALASEGTKEIFDDVPKFSNKSPVFFVGTEVGKSES